MGKQQTAGQIKGEWHSRRKEVVSMWLLPVSWLLPVF